MRRGEEITTTAMTSLIAESEADKPETECWHVLPPETSWGELWGDRYCAAQYSTVLKPWIHEDPRHWETLQSY